MIDWDEPICWNDGTAAKLLFRGSRGRFLVSIVPTPAGVTAPQPPYMAKGRPAVLVDAATGYPFDDLGGAYIMNVDDATRSIEGLATF